ncbi:MAG TPA: SRPBCC domain-containing protein [Nitriliruptorales bacterium]|nr:SRPBCC domain-containing protein [Nitriliruptorales bacterium]
MRLREGGSIYAVERTVHLATGIEEAWEMVSGALGLASWLGADVDIDLRPGGRLAVTDWDGTAMVGRIEDVVDCQRLVFTWWPHRSFGLPHRSRVELTIEPAADGGTATLLRLREQRMRPPQVSIQLPSPPATAADPRRGDTERDLHRLAEGPHLSPLTVAAPA